MKFRLLVLLAFLAIPTLVFAQKNKYIGYRYVGVSYNQTLPNGVKDLGGSLLEDDNYAVSRMKKGKTEMLWLARITSRNAKGIPKWQVKYVLNLPALKKNQEILRGFTFPCKINDEEDLNLIVLADYLPKSKTYKVRKAWRANTRANRIQAVSIKGISCEIEEPESY